MYNTKIRTTLIDEMTGDEAAEMVAVMKDHFPQAEFHALGHDKFESGATVYKLIVADKEGSGVMLSRHLDELTAYAGGCLAAIRYVPAPLAEPEDDGIAWHKGPAYAATSGFDSQARIDVWLWFIRDGYAQHRGMTIGGTRAEALTGARDICEKRHCMSLRGSAEYDRSFCEVKAWAVLPGQPIAFETVYDAYER